MFSIDRVIGELDRALRAIAGVAHAARPSPADDVPEAELDESERKHAAALMRVNHVGEVCAQALYQGQALTARDKGMAKNCKRRRRGRRPSCVERRADSRARRRPSLLNPLWYAGLFAFGRARRRARRPLESVRSLPRPETGGTTSQRHLEALPAQDRRTHRGRRSNALRRSRGTANCPSTRCRKLPQPAKAAMRLASRVMTTVAYRV